MISSSRLVNCSRSASSAPQSAASVRPQPLSVVPQLLVRRRGAARAIPDVAQAEAVCTTANAIADISLIDAATAGALQVRSCA